MTVYFFSGLGADERIFQKLILPEDWNIVHIRWPGIQKRESLDQYSSRISQQIDSVGDYSFVGLSFGGIVAVELSKILSPKHLIIISSISNNRELSFFYRIIHSFKLHKLIPHYLFTRTSFVTWWFFGITSKEERMLLRSVIKETSPQFIKWAVGQILSWKNDKRPSNILHIHGNKDRLFSFRKVRANIKIDGGGHFMVYNKAKEIGPVIVGEINDSTN